MMKFTMNAKDLKTMMEKGMAAINKKVTLSTLTRLYFQIDENGILKVLGTDMEHWAEVRTDNAYDTQPGILGIDVDDIKIISKMSGEITLEDVTTDDMKSIRNVIVQSVKEKNAHTEEHIEEYLRLMVDLVYVLI